jgi:NTP pyrophosphatase (non-canonical NTP hydrolase)
MHPPTRIVLVIFSLWPTLMNETHTTTPEIALRDFQALIKTMYFEKDKERGVSGTFMWLMEELGELASALRANNDRDNLEEEFADVLAWLTTIANVAEIDLTAAISKKYGHGCPGCRKLVCVCPNSEKP